MIERREVALAAPAVGKAEADALRDVVDSGWITMGEAVRRFEHAFAQRHDMEHAVSVSSGTAGLHLSLAAFGLGSGDEVLIPSLTFVACANACWYTGAKPVSVDIESVDRPHMSLSDAQDRLTSRTKAVMVVHYGGWLCPMEAWRAFAREHELILLEDACHAPALNGVAAQGDAAVFSFYGNKNMTTAEGGIVLTHNPDLAGRIKRLRNHGMSASTSERQVGQNFTYDVTDLGFNYRMDELRAAIGLVQLDKLLDWNRYRVALLQRYRAAFAASGSGVTLPFDGLEATAGHLCPALLPNGVNRKNLMQALREAGVQTSVHYPPIHTFSYYESRLGSQKLPKTETFAARELSLPLHPGLELEDVDYVVEQLTSVLNSHGGGYNR